MLPNDVLNLLREIAPEETAMVGDPVGLLVAGEHSVIDTVGVCLDCTPTAALRAVEQDVQIIVAHHPLLYHPLKRIVPDTDPVSRAVVTLIKADISLYAMHTNWDRANGGINDTLAETLELNTIRPFADGLPRIGDLPAPRPFADFAHFVGAALDCAGTSALRINAIAPDTLISRVAVCGGAGASYLSAAIAAGAEAFVTSDVRHHEFIEATGLGFALLDAGHDATETPGMRVLARLLGERLPGVTVVWLGE